MAKKVNLPSQLKPHKQQFPRSVSASSSVYILSANVPTACDKLRAVYSVGNPSPLATCARLTDVPAL
ncbi:hypothetical protein MTO96_014870 [Rhipicephalus appendiculatus]